jgi:hypothetical protein
VAARHPGEWDQVPSLSFPVFATFSSHSRFHGPDRLDLEFTFAIRSRNIEGGTPKRTLGNEGPYGHCHADTVND